MKQYTLGRTERLKSRKQIEALFAAGASFHAGFLKVYHMPVQQAKAGTAPLQMGAGAGKRYFKKAVDRNRIKRLIREAYRHQKAALALQLLQQQKQVAVFFIYTGRELPNYASVEEKMALALRRINDLYTCVS